MATNTIYINNWCILVPSTFGRARDTIWPCSMEAVLPSSKQYQRQKRGKKTSLTSSDLMPLKRAIFAAICHFVALCAGDRLAAFWSSCTGWCLCNLWLRILSTITEETYWGNLYYLMVTIVDLFQLDPISWIQLLLVTVTWVNLAIVTCTLDVLATFVSDSLPSTSFFSKGNYINGAYDGKNARATRLSEKNHLIMLNISSRNIIWSYHP